MSSSLGSTLFFPRGDFFLPAGFRGEAALRFLLVDASVLPPSVDLFFRVAILDLDYSPNMRLQADYAKRLHVRRSVE
ncbi:MAG: hypothetical protein QOI04_2372 [Verrucomicrobiota bacterium]|jgi:hypothetical protein